MEKHPIGDMMEATMQKIREMVDVNMIIGQPISASDGIMLIPVSKASFGFASGGSDFTTKSQKADQSNPFGGGAGASVKIEPVAFIVIKDGNVRIMQIAPPASGTVERIIDSAPEIIDKISETFSKGKNKTENI